MNKSAPVVMACMLLAACGKAAPTDAVESLAAQPDHLREVEKQCADNYAQMGAAECNNAADARRRLFIGNGPQYTPPKDPPKF